jgi:hypothetical protein
MFYNLLVHVTLVFSVLSIFFLVFVSKIMDKSFNDQLDQAVANNTPKIFPKELKNYIQLLSKRYQSEDPVKRVNNQWLRVIIITLMSTLIVLSLVFSVITQKPILSVLSENLVTFAVVGAVEMMFFLKVVTKYVPIPPSFMLETIVTGWNGK